jgi:hypothetical protein
MPWVLTDTHTLNIQNAAGPLEHFVNVPAGAGYARIVQTPSTTSEGLWYCVTTDSVGGRHETTDGNCWGGGCHIAAHDHDFALPPGTLQVSMVVQSREGFPTGTTLQEVYFDSVTFCTYGTRVKAGIADFLVVTLDVIIAVAAAVATKLRTAFGLVVLGKVMDVRTLCSTLPPVAQDLTLEDYLALISITDTLGHARAVAKVEDIFRAAAWQLWCECVPGSPSPTVPPVPAPTIDPVLPDPVVYSCDQEDVCALLNHITSQQDVLANYLMVVRQQVGLIQSQGTPFTYLTGAVHTGLTGVGTFDVRGILGLSIHSTTIPSYLSSDMVPVQSWFRLGEVSWGTTDGWMARHIVTHDPHLFLGIEGGISRVGYHFLPGVVANITELVRQE